VLPAGVTSLQRINCNLDRPLFKIYKPLIMKKILLLLLTLSLFFACNKDDEPTPENWTEDDNIFRCKVNGVDWEPEGGGLGFSGGNLDVYYESFFNNAIQIRASKDNDNVSQFLSMFVGVDLAVNGKSEILTNNVFVDYNSCGNYFRDTTVFNFIKFIEIDSINNIAEGEFEFIGLNSDCPDTIKVTDGYFKAKYR
jgi:hypothetical protein